MPTLPPLSEQKSGLNKLSIFLSPPLSYGKDEIRFWLSPLGLLQNRADSTLPFPSLSPSIQKNNFICLLSFRSLGHENTVNAKPVPPFFSFCRELMTVSFPPSFFRAPAGGIDKFSPFWGVSLPPLLGISKKPLFYYFLFSSRSPRPPKTTEALREIPSSFFFSLPCPSKNELNCLVCLPFPFVETNEANGPYTIPFSFFFPPLPVPHPKHRVHSFPPQKKPPSCRLRPGVFYGKKSSFFPLLPPFHVSKGAGCLSAQFLFRATPKNIRATLGIQLSLFFSTTEKRRFRRSLFFSSVWWHCPSFAESAHGVFKWLRLTAWKVFLLFFPPFLVAGVWATESLVPLARFLVWSLKEGVF